MISDTNTKYEDSEYKTLNLSSLKYSDKEILMEDALDGIEPISWAEDILNGDRKVVIARQ